MSEIQKLLQELQAMKHEAKLLENNKETWRKIANKDLIDLGFESEEELKQWILSNPYSNIV